MANILKIETERLKRDISSIDKNIATVKNSISRTQAALRVLNFMWEGEAKKAFRTSADRDIQEMHDVLALLTQYRNDLEQASKTYDSAASSAEAMIKSMKI